jgi:soluble lytic murein transglycosylase
MVTARTALSRPDYSGTIQEYKLLYPRAFLSRIKELGSQYGIPLPVLYGLVREESYFDPEIVSHAGAVGLSQLMPTTAEHVASLMKKESYDLTDPNDNLEIGSYYLGRMLNRFDRISYSLFAYNAGPGRVTEWDRKFGSLPDELFLEAIPFQETRHYLRKVLVTAVFYGYLYENEKPEKVIQLFFPEYALKK